MGYRILEEETVPKVKPKFKILDDTTLPEEKQPLISGRSTEPFPTDFDAMLQNVERPMVDLSNLPGSDITRKTAELAIPALMATGGGAIGSAAGTAGVLIGSGYGYALGKRLMEMAKGERYDIAESFINSAKDMASGIVYEGTGQLIGKGINKFLTHHAEKVNRRLLEEAKQLGLQPTATDLTDSKTYAQFETMVRRLYGSGQLFHKNDLAATKRLIQLYDESVAKEANPKTIEELGGMIKDNVDDILTRVAQLKGQALNNSRNILLRNLGSDKSYQELGALAKTRIAGRSRGLSNLVNKQYETVKQLIENKIPIDEQDVPLTETKKVAEKLWYRLSINENVASKYTNEIDELEKVFKPKENDWESVELLRRSYRDKMVSADQAYQGIQQGITKGQIEKGKSGPALVYSLLKNAIQKDQTKYTESLGDDIQKLYETAKANSARLKTVFGSPEIVKLTQSNPGIVIDEILSPSGYQEIEMVKKALGETNFNRVIKPAITNKLLGVGRFGNYDPAYTKSQISSLNQQLLNKIYSSEELKQITDLTEWGIDFGKRTLTDNVLKGIASSRPEDAYGIAKKAFESSGKSLYSNLSRIYTYADQPTRDALKYQMTVKLFTDKQPPAAIETYSIGKIKPELLGFSGSVFKKNLTKFYPLLRKFGYSADDIGLLKKIAYVAERLKGAERLAGNPLGIGQAMVTQAQLTIGGYRLLSGDPVGAGAIIGGPYVLARAFLSPVGRKWLSEGFQMSASSQKAIEWLAKLEMYQNDLKVDQMNNFGGDIENAKE